MSKRDVVVLGAARSPIGTFGGSLAEIEPAELAARCGIRHRRAREAWRDNGDLIGTKMVIAIPKDVLDSKIIPQIPMGRLGKPEEVAGLVTYLRIEQAAFSTGENIAVNGGQHMQ